MFVLFGTNDPKCNTLAFRGVTLIYTSIAPKDDKTKYIKRDCTYDVGLISTPPSKLIQDENVQSVYVVEFFDNSEPKVLPTDEFMLNYINEKDSSL